jgi:hypothetical protein
LNRKMLMSLSAVFMAMLGILGTFMPQEILNYADAGAGAEGLLLLIVQIAGALYMGFAILNWMARFSLIGGIYNRPVAIGNFLHFTMVALVLIKALTIDQSAEIVVGTVIYAVFAIWFGLTLFARRAQGGKK